MPDLKIYVATHKIFSPPFDENYIPVQGGKTSSPDVTPYIGDNTGENISDLNKYFSELSVHYWVWKNDLCSEIIGLNHYRRYFAKRHHGLNCYVDEYKNGSPVLIRKNEIAASNDFSEFNEGGNIILPTRFDCGTSVYKNYDGCHFIEDMYIVREIIVDIYPDYVSAFDFLMQNSSRFTLANMMVARRWIFEEYSEWLFSILLRMQTMNFYKFYDDYQKRILGFISERIMSVWLLKNRSRLSPAYRDIVVVE